jgi:very-short-patch-repair endonuclease
MKKRRQSLRNSAPRAEVILWRYLKGKQISGNKFRRQYSIGGYVVDFYCPTKRLAIEVDGITHLSREAKVHDKIRQVYIEEFNITFLRFTNSEIYKNIQGVVDAIHNFVARRNG